MVWRALARSVSVGSSIDSALVSKMTPHGAVLGSASAVAMVWRACARSVSVGSSFSSALVSKMTSCGAVLTVSAVVMVWRACARSVSVGSSFSSASIRSLTSCGAAWRSTARIAFSWLMSPQCAKLAISSGWWGTKVSLRARIRAWFALVQSFGSVWAATSSTNSSRRSLTTFWAGVGLSVWWVQSRSTSPLRLLWAATAMGRATRHSGSNQMWGSSAFAALAAEKVAMCSETRYSHRVRCRNRRSTRAWSYWLEPGYSCLGATLSRARSMAADIWSGVRFVVIVSGHTPSPAGVTASLTASQAHCCRIARHASVSTGFSVVAQPPASSRSMMVR